MFKVGASFRALLMAYQSSLTAEIFLPLQPVLLLALDDYFTNPNVECLVRLYEAINNLDLSGMPEFTREEKLILRASDRRDMFEERFHLRSSEEDEDGSKNDLSGADGPDFAYSADEHDPNRPRAGSGSTLSETDSRSMRRRPSQIDVLPNGMSRRPSGANSIDRRPSGPISPLPSSGRPRDTHFFDTRIVYRSIPIPIRLPLTTFTEEVGEVSAGSLNGDNSKHSANASSMHTFCSIPSSSSCKHSHLQHPLQPVLSTRIYIPMGLSPIPSFFSSMHWPLRSASSFSGTANRHIKWHHMSSPHVRWAAVAASSSEGSHPERFRTRTSRTLTSSKKCKCTNSTHSHS